MLLMVLFFFFKQKTAYELRISDWSSDVCSSDLYRERHWGRRRGQRPLHPAPSRAHRPQGPCRGQGKSQRQRSCASHHPPLRIGIAVRVSTHVGGGCPRNCCRTVAFSGSTGSQWAPSSLNVGRTA